MRHKSKGRKFNRTWEHRKAMFHNMVRSLIIHGRIKTTVSKAKELRGLADGLITLALRNDLHARRQAFKVLGSHQLVKKLFDEVGPQFASSAKGGYTRVVKLATVRPGDAAPLAFIEFAYESTKTEKSSDKPAKKAPAKTPEAPVEAAPEAAPEAVAEEAAPETVAEAAEEAVAEEATEEVIEEAAEEAVVEAAPETDSATEAEAPAEPAPAAEEEASDSAPEAPGAAEGESTEDESKSKE